MPLPVVKNMDAVFLHTTIFFMPGRARVAAAMVVHFTGNRAATRTLRRGT
jgi:hypothetical protein